MNTLKQLSLNQSSFVLNQNTFDTIFDNLDEDGSDTLDRREVK